MEALASKLKNSKFYSMLRGIDGLLGRKIFGVDQLANRYIRGRYESRKYQQKKSSTPFTRDSDIKKFNNTGVLELPILDRKVIEPISRQVSDQIIDPKYSEVKAKDQAGETVSLKLKKPLETVHGLPNLITDDVINAVECYYGCNFEITSVFIWRNFHIESKNNKTKEVYSSHFHHDQYKSTMLKFFIYLTDVTEQDGPFHYYTKGTSTRIIKAGYRGRNDYGKAEKMMLDQDLIKKFLGGSGSRAIVNTTQCLHAAGVPEEGHYRDMCQFVMFPSHEKLSKDWWKSTDLGEQKNFRRGK